MNKFAINAKRLVVSVVAASILAAGVVHADPNSQQNNKNLWRNLTIGSGVVAAHGLLTHHSGEALIGAAGAAYSASRYENDRHHQSQDQQRAKDNAYNRAAWLNRHRSSGGRHYYASNGHVYYTSHGYTRQYS